MIKVVILLFGASVVSYGRPPGEGSLHVVYSKMLSEVGMVQPEPRSGVAYVYSITATELPSLTESASMKSTEILFPQEISIKGSSRDIPAAPKALPSKDNVASKQLKEKKSQFLSIDPLDPKANESEIS